jgi:hypothetical protein
MISKKFLTDENQKPIAVLIDYQDWLLIEKQLELSVLDRSAKINALAGSIQFPIDAMKFQHTLREEWDR